MPRRQTFPGEWDEVAWCVRGTGPRGQGTPSISSFLSPSCQVMGSESTMFWLPPALNFTLSEGAQSLFLEGTKNL